MGLGHEPAKPRLRFDRRHIAPIAATAAVVGMLALVAVSLPLYRAFCSLTGYEGTPRIVSGASLLKGTRIMHVRFDSNVGGSLPWTGRPRWAATSTRSPASASRTRR